jgi:serine/threonine protein kinase
MKKAEIIRLNQVTHTLDERSIMMMLQHPFIVNLYATFQDDRRLYMLLEFVNGGELYAYLQTEGKLPSDHARFYVAEIMLAFAYLHSLHVVYRDLKPENVLIDPEGHIKITDFGFAKIVLDCTWTLCGTPDYLAPEMIQGQRGHGKGVDWWALGVLAFEMLTGFRPFLDDSPAAIYKKISRGVIEYPKDMDVKALDLVKRLLEVDVSKRYGCRRRGADDVKRHKWFKGIDWRQLLHRNASGGVPFVPRLRSSDDTARFNRYPDSTGEPDLPSAEEQALFVSYSTGARAQDANQDHQSTTSSTESSLE